ncbi:MAG: thioesterase [Clostridia bacterium]|nr:thioesterase [Clostridia bacterium]
MIWAEQVTVNSHDCDVNSILRPTGVMRLMQEAASDHLYAVGRGESELRADDRAFIVSTISFDVIKPIMMRDKLRVKTWEAGSRGVKFMRYYTVERDGETIAGGECVCALVEISTGKLMRVDCDALWNSKAETAVYTPELNPHFITDSHATFTDAGDFSVSYSFIDRNDHMNNTCYADMFYGAVPGHDEKCLSSMAVSYVRSAHLGDVLGLSYYERDGVYYMRSCFADGTVNATAKVKLT